MSTDEPTDDEVVQTASDAAEGLIFSRYKQSAVRDCDVTVTFEDGVLEVDVYLNVPEAEAEDGPGPGPEQVADAAARAAQDAVDDLFAE